MKNPELSIIIPALNEEENIENFLKDLQENSYTKYEVIVSDNGSTDDTESIVKRLGRKDARIKLVNSPIKGIGRTRNVGAKAAKGEYLLFVDADTRVSKDFLEIRMREVKRRNLDVAGGLISPEGGDLFDKILFWIFCDKMMRILQYTPLPASPGGAGIIIKKELHMKTGGFQEDTMLAEDHWYSRKAKGIPGTRFGIIGEAKARTDMRRFKKEGKMKVWLKWATGSLYYLLNIKMEKMPFQYE
jgi:glycosyltransferase involved in cell wall biosynthesis